MIVVAVLVVVVGGGGGGGGDSFIVVGGMLTGGKGRGLPVVYAEMICNAATIVVTVLVKMISEGLDALRRGHGRLVFAYILLLLLLLTCRRAGVLLSRSIDSTLPNSACVNNGRFCDSRSN